MAEKERNLVGSRRDVKYEPCRLSPAPDGDGDSDSDSGDGDGDGDEVAGLLLDGSEETIGEQFENEDDDGNARASSDEAMFLEMIHKTLFPDSNRFSFNGHQLVEDNNGGVAAIKLFKFIALTFIMISITHVIVAQFFDDRDQSLKLLYIWIFEADLIVRDCFVFFIVGRLYEQKGVDHIAFVGTVILANIYFESQNFLSFLQHSATLYQMHCVWPWQLWIFVLTLVPAIVALVGAHIIKARTEGTLVRKVTELGLCVLFFVAPMITSDYFHMHHWYAGWLFGMHANYNVWWSRFAMAWCWGMYINGIAVYGRDPVLTCEYAFFLTVDNRCPYISCYLDGLNNTNNTNVTEMIPVDWRNCSADPDSFHP